MATLHYVYGWPCAGKTTLACELATSLSAVLFCEDEWLLNVISEPITTAAAFVEASGRVRRLIAPLATRLLELGTSIVFDFGGNTPAQRAWVRGIAEGVSARWHLHVLEVPPAECRRRLHERNAAKPAGLYFGDVSDDLFDAVIARIVPPEPYEIGPSP